MRAAGSVRTSGPGAFRTVTWKKALAAMPLPARHVTVVLPSGKVAPDGGVHEGVTRRPSSTAVAV
jgi:hypothetical protein